MRKRPIQQIVRLNEKEHQHLIISAELAGLSKESFIRKLIMGETVKPKPPNELAALLRELQAIGNNINQMARLANSRKYIAAGELAQIEKLLDDIWIKVKEL